MTLKLDGPLVLAGAGNMGGAMLQGWLERGLDPRSIVVQDPAPPPAIMALLNQHGVTCTATIASLPSPPAVITVAVKPQLMDTVFPALAKLAAPGTVVLSIAAGRTIASFETYLPPKTAVVRSIPNTPASIGRGITAAFANAHVSAKQKAACDALLAAVGEVGWLGDEALIDAATAVSGSGPAYVFLLAECLAQAGVAAGLPVELAQRLARATVSGAGELLHRSGLPPSQLRKNVTSTGGTTAAALEVLMAADGMQALFTRAVAAATARSRALSS